MRFLREVIALGRLVARTPRDDKAITFYAESESDYAYFDGLVRELTERAGATITYLTSDPEDELLAAPRPRLRVFYLDRLLPFYMALCRARVFVMTLMDLHQFHLRRSLHDVHYVYVFHGLGSTHRSCREGAFDHYDSILCVGPHHVREIRRREQQCGLPRKELVEAGYDRLDRIRRSAESAGAGALRPLVLVAPSWHAGNLLEVCGAELLEALAAAGCDVVLRLHPEARRRARAHLADLEARYGATVRFEHSVLTDDSLVAADVLVTDGSMIALEYAFGVERPVIFVDGPGKVRNERWRDLELEPLELALRAEIGVTIDPADVARVGDEVERLVRGREAWRERLVRLRTEHVFAPGSAAAVGARYVLERAGLGSAVPQRPGPERPGPERPGPERPGGAT